MIPIISRNLGGVPMKTSWIRLVCVALTGGFLVFLLGCAPRISTEAEIQAAAAEVPDVDKYELGPEDAIEVSVWKEPDLTKQLVVRPDGKISFPLVGELQAAGKTVSQVRDEIHSKLEKYVTDAQVTVILLKAQHYKIYVVGKVNKPGEQLVGRPTTVMQALAMAGGLTPFASPGNIVVLRKAGDQNLVYPFNYSAVARGESLEQNRTLVPGDVVVVP